MMRAEARREEPPTWPPHMPVIEPVLRLPPNASTALPETSSAESVTMLITPQYAFSP